MANNNRVRVEETLKIKIGEAKNIVSHKDTYCAVALDNEQIFSTQHVNSKFSNPFYGEEYQCEVPRKFRYLNFYLCEKSNKQDKTIGKVAIKKDELNKYYGREQWFPLTPVSSNTEVQGKVQLDVKFCRCREQPTEGDVKPCRITCRVISCEDLTVTNGGCNPYAVVMLHRLGTSSKHKDDTRRTVTLKKTTNPNYDQLFVFELDRKTHNPDYSNYELSVTLWHDDSRVSREMFGMNRGVFLGEMRINLSDVDPPKHYTAWHFLQPRGSAPDTNAAVVGSLRVKICYMADHVFPSQHYNQLRNLLLQSTVPVTSSAAYLLGEIVDAKEEVAHSLVRILHNRNQVVQFVADMADWEIANTLDPNTIFRGNTLASKCIDELMKLMGLPYLQDTLKAVIEQIFHEKKPCEIDKSRLKDGDNLETNMANLTGYVEKILDNIVFSGLQCPLVMCQVFCALKQSALKHFPGKPEVGYQVVSGFVFLRFFAPAILGPKLFQLSSDVPDPVVHRTLTLISKAIQGMGNIVSTKTQAFGFKEDYMRPVFTHFMEGRMLEEARTFLDIISSLTRMSSTDTCGPVVLKQGWLIKRAQGRRKYGLKNFKKRFFCLTNHALTYSKGEHKNSLCSIPIEDILAVEELQEEAFTRKYMFQVVQPRRALYVQASNCVEARQWKHILNKVCNMNKNRLKVYHPGAYLKGHWLCCKCQDSSVEGCTPVTGALPASINLDLDEDREMERLHYLLISHLPRLDRMLDLIQQHTNDWEATCEWDANTRKTKQRSSAVQFHTSEEDSGVSSQAEDASMAASMAAELILLGGENNKHSSTLVKSSQSEPSSIIHSSKSLTLDPDKQSGVSSKSLTENNTENNKNSSKSLTEQNGVPGRNVRLRRDIETSANHNGNYPNTNAKSCDIAALPAKPVAPQGSWDTLGKFSYKSESDSSYVGGMGRGSCDTLATLATSCESLQVQMLEDPKGSYRSLLDLRVAAVELQQIHQQYLSDLQKHTVLGSQEFPFGDNGYINIHHTKL